MGRKKIATAGKKIANGNYSLRDGDSSKLVVAVSHRNEGQKRALRAISENKVTFLYGTPGTGKTFCAVGFGLQEMIMHNRFEQIIFTRPVVEAGESLGYLPGDAQQKVAPYMMPMFDVVSQYLSSESISELVDKKKIIVLPLAYMRGTTFRHSYVICDEMQNATSEQMHLLLTRIGEGSKVVITGDTEQSDLSYHRYRQDNGLSDAVNRLKDIDGLGFVELGYESCVRERIVSDIDARYRMRKSPEMPKWEASPELEDIGNRISQDMDEILDARNTIDDEE